MPTTTDPFYAFDPNGTVQTVWAVWDGYQFYVKSKRGGGLTRLRNAQRGKLYELTAQGWVEHAVKDLDNHSDDCDLCKQPNLRAKWDAHDQQKRNFWQTGVKQGWAWKRESSKISSPPELLLLCPDCKSATEWY